MEELKKEGIIFQSKTIQNTTYDAHKYYQKKSGFRSRYLIIIGISLLAFLFVPSDSLDSYRYYLYAKTISPDQPLFELIKGQYFIYFDFIYYVYFYFCNKFGLPYQLVTGVSVGLLFEQTLTFIDLIQKKYKYKLTKSNDLLLRSFSLLSVSFIAVFAISRNVTALMFFFFGVNNQVKDNKIKAWLFFLISCFTHVGLIPYLLLFLLGYYWKGALIKDIYIRRIILVLASIIGINSYLFIGMVLKPLEMIPFFGGYIYYLQYIIIDVSVNRVTYSTDLSKGDVLMYYTTSFILFYGLYFLRKYNSIIWSSYIMYVWLLISMGYSIMFTQRTLLFLIPFQGAVASAFFAQRNKSLTVVTYKVLLGVAFLAFIGNVYVYRDEWIFKFPDF